MRSRPWLIAIACLSAASSVLAQKQPFDLIYDDLKSYVQSGPLGLPMKISSVSRDEYQFWRGAKLIFCDWAKTNCADWMADPKSYVINHGDPHLGNIGTYVSEADWGRLAVGMVDFDESAMLPFQIELLQGAITMELVAYRNAIPLSTSQRTQLHATLIDSYFASLAGNQNASAILESDSMIASLLKQANGKQYRDELKKFCANGKLRPIVSKKSGKVTDILTPIDLAQWDSFATGIEQATRNSDRLAKLTGVLDEMSARKLISDIALRTRVDSSGSQGLKKYLVVLEKPFAGIDHDIILYLKQQIPSAAERSGLIAKDSRSPGERVARDMDRLTDPNAIFSSFCEIGGDSYWVYLKEPWSEEIDYETITDITKLFQAARIWAQVAGSAHRNAGFAQAILPPSGEKLKQQISHRSAEYLQFHRQAFAQFKSDPRVAESSRQAEAEIRRRLNQP